MRLWPLVLTAALGACRTTSSSSPPTTAAVPSTERPDADAGQPERVTLPPVEVFDAGLEALPPPQAPDAGKAPSEPRPVARPRIDAGVTPARAALDAGAPTVVLAVADAGAIHAPPALRWVRTGPRSGGFTGTGPAGFKIEGITPDVEVDDDGGRFTITIGFAHMTTGIALRDQHMREKYLHTDRFPTATFVVPTSQLELPRDGTLERTVTGTMTIHGTPRSQALTYRASCAAGRCDITGSGGLDGVTVDSYLGMTVRPQVTVKAKFSIEQRPAP